MEASKKVKRYLSATTNEFFRDPELYGCMFSYKTTGKQWEALKADCYWMLDNGAFSGKFNEEGWTKRLKKMQKYSATCLGIVIPDKVILKQGKFHKGDWKGTLENLHRYIDIVRRYGLPIAYAVQDDHPIDQIPWKDIDTLFIAGRDEWKTSFEVEQIAREGKVRGKHIHIARVSQLKRFQATWWADTWDGTTFKWEPEVKHNRFKPFLTSEKAEQWRLL